MQTYNLFRRKGRHRPRLRGAGGAARAGFPERRPGIFTGRIDSPAETPLGFDGKAAAAGVRFNGFYLFADFGRRLRDPSGTAYPCRPAGHLLAGPRAGWAPAPTPVRAAAWRRPARRWPP